MFKSNEKIIIIFSFHNMDLEYINLIISLIALLSSFIGHLRHSRCCYGLIDIDMKTSKPSTPIEENARLGAFAQAYQSQANQLLLNTENSSPILQSSDPISIPEKKIFTRQNYL